MRNWMHKGVQFPLGAFFVLLISIASTIGFCQAQAPGPAIAPGKPAATTVPTNAAKGEAHPFWTELTAVQQVALAPLQAEWSKIDGFRKKKWVQISSRFASMKPDEQQRLQERMRIWAKLTPDERRHARETYSRAKSLDHEQKSAQWQQYQLLSDSEKKKLAADIAAKKHVANLPNATNGAVIKPPIVLGAPDAKAPVKVSKPNVKASGNATVPKAPSNVADTAPVTQGDAPTPAATSASK